MGFRQLFLRFSGCDLRCVWCDTPDSLTRPKLPTALTGLTPQALLNLVSEYQGNYHSLSVTGGEPLLQVGFLEDFLRAYAAFRPVYLETAGHRHKEMQVLAPLVDIVSLDFKLPSSTGERELWEEHKLFLQACVGKRGYIKITLSGATALEEIERAARLVAGSAPLDFCVVLQGASAVQNALGDFAVPSSSQLIAAFDVAVAVLGEGRVRLLGQLHKSLGLP